MNNHVNSLLQQAINNFEQGNLNQTKLLLENILGIQPKNFPALHIMGVVLGIQNKHKDAVAFLLKAVKINPNDGYVNFNLAKALSEIGDDSESIRYHRLATKINSKQPEAWLNFGKTLYYLNRHEEALTHYDQAIQLKPDYAEAWSNKGATLNELKRFEEALSHYDQAIQLKPDYAEAWSNKGVTLNELKRFEEALSHYDQAIQLKPDYAEAWSNKGVTLNELKRFEEALSHYDQAIQLKPDYAEAWSNKGVTLNELKRFEEALSHYDQAIQLKPDYAEAWSNKGVTLNELKRFEEALSHYDQAIQLKPDYAKAWLNKGNVLKDLKRYEETLSHYDQAIQLKPDYAEAWSNKGVALHELKRFEEALSHYDQAIQLKPDYFDSYWNKSLIFLSLGDFKNGWDLYSFRWKTKDSTNYRYDKFKKLESLNNLTNKNILVWWEQGFGDTIQFSRYIPKLIELGANVTFELQKPLLNLLGGQSNYTTSIENGQQFDFEIPLLSLPKLFNTKIDNIPSPTSIEVKSECILHWRNKLNLSDKRLNIGIAISGNSNHKNDLNRSINFDYITPLLDLGNFFLIQKDLNPIDSSSLIKNKNISFLGNQIHDFVDTAAIVMNMDLIISVDTSLIHLAGSLNKQSYLMLPWCPEWRWLLDRPDSPWYPSIKIFRQVSIGDWGSVIEKIKYELSKFNQKSPL